MPRCEGLPSGPCPAGTNDSTVRSTQGDLFLCPSCDEARFPTTSTSVKKNSRTFTSSDTKRRTNPKPTQCTKSCAETKVNTSGPTDDKSASRGPRTASRTFHNTKAGSDKSDPDDSCCIDCLEPTDEGCIKCDMCQHSYHQECSGLHRDILDILRNVIDQTGWVCLNCRSSHFNQQQKLQSAIAHLTEQLADVHIAMAKLKSEVDELKQNVTTTATTSTTTTAAETASKTVPTRLPYGQPADTKVFANSDHKKENITEVSLQVHKTLSDINRRKRNVIISGLPESSAVESSLRSSDDVAAFMRLCEEHLSTKPSLANEGCRRLGKLSDTNHRPRRLLIRLTSEENATHILTAAKRLRHSDDQYVATSVYINRDLSPTEAKLAYEKREQWRARKRSDATGCTVVKSTDSEESSTVTESEAQTCTLQGTHPPAEITSLTSPANCTVDHVAISKSYSSDDARTSIYNTRASTTRQQ